jgi:hypothetical protein
LGTAEAVGFEITPQRCLVFGLGIFSAVIAGKGLLKGLSAEKNAETIHAEFR